MLSIGIVGLPNVGKSTLFNALTGNKALAANYPFATIEPNTGIVNLPDARLDKLAVQYKTHKTVYATVTFVDIAGLVAGASKGEGLGNQFLANIRECSAIAHVIRVFEDDDVLHVMSRIAPEDDRDIITTELALADLSTVDKKIGAAQKEAKLNAKKAPYLAALTKAKSLLEETKPLSENMTPEELVQLRELNLLTAKPVIYVFNVDEGGLVDTALQNKLRQMVAPASAVFVSAKLESELKDLSQEDQDELLVSYGVHESGLAQLARVGYETLGLQSYFTAGEKETRAWTIHKGDTAPQAAGVIHGDFERGFIAAQIVNYEDLLTAGSELAAKNAGKMRTEGKTYVMLDGDVVEFKFNV